MIRTLLAGAAAITMISGHARAETPPDPSSTMGHSRRAPANCPMNVAGAKVATALTPTGTTLTFTTTSLEQVAELRRRVQEASEMHNRNHGSGGMRGDMAGDDLMGGMSGGNHMMDGTTGSGHMMGSGNAPAHMNGGQMMPQSRASTTEVAHGACITLTPSDPTELKKLQSAVGTRADRMQQHGCGPVARK